MQKWYETTIRFGFGLYRNSSHTMFNSIWLCRYGPSESCKTSAEVKCFYELNLPPSWVSDYCFWELPCIPIETTPHHQHSYAQWGKHKLHSANNGMENTAVKLLDTREDMPICSSKDYSANIVCAARVGPPRALLKGLKSSLSGLWVHIMHQWLQIPITGRWGWVGW